MDAKAHESLIKNSQEVNDFLTYEGLTGRNATVAIRAVSGYLGWKAQTAE